MGKFEKLFDTPLMCTDGSFMISRECYTHDEAIDILNKSFEEDGEYGYLDMCPAVKLKKDRIRFTFHGGEIEGFESNEPCWVCGQTGRGSKRIWLLE